MKKPLRILVVGCGHMGTSHATAYEASPDFEIAGLVSRSPRSREALLKKLLPNKKYALFGDYEEALAATKPDGVCISTYPDTHAEYAAIALESGCHVFLEKPIATSLKDAAKIIELSRNRRRKLVVGYILQHHPAWQRFVEEAQKLGKPLVMRMNLNQQSSGAEWETHKQILNSMSPIVDCGVHYIDVMCRMTKARPVSVYAIGARLSADIPRRTYNYGQMQVRFEDGSIGWYEAGWGPMMSQTAFFIKDVIGPEGSASITASSATLHDSADVNAHTKTDSIFVHRSTLNSEGNFLEKDLLIEMSNEPDHDALCALEQAYFLKSIQEDLDLDHHLDAAASSLQIVLAADESIRSGKVVGLS